MTKQRLIPSDVKRVVGLAYDSESDTAPKLSLKGEGLIAKRVVELAARYNIPVVERPDIVSTLSPFEVDQEIPESLYEPVAILLHEFKRGWR